MGVISAAAKELLAAGVTGDALVTALERIEEAGRPVRSAAAERMIRYRQRIKEASPVTHETHGDADGFPDKEKSPTPPKEINPSPSLRSDSFGARASAPESGCRLEFTMTFWPAYPNKVGHRKAIQAFIAARQRADLETIMVGVRRYAASKPEGRQWLNPANFLEEDRWNDEPAPVAQAPPLKRQHPTNGWASLARKLTAEDNANGSGTGNGAETDGPAGEGFQTGNGDEDRRLLDAERSDASDGTYTVPDRR